MSSSPPVSAPPALVEIAGRVNDRIGQVLGDDAARWGCLDPSLDAPLSSLRSLVLSGGKRLRPAFCYWAFVGAGGDPADDRVVAAGAALELLHTFALIHDDVMDDSPLRHGVETLHVDYARRHRDGGWRGEADRFGTAVAILVGDLAFVYADRLLTGAPRMALDVWNDLRLEVNVGQYLDLAGTARSSANPELARRICQYKSGKYTVERPLHLGAALVGVEPTSQSGRALTAYGVPLGEAFQLRDDILGVFGDPAVTGKPVGEDLRDGKPTLLYALARAAATGAGAELFEHRFGRPDLDESEVCRLQEVIEQTGARRQVLGVIDSLVDQALAAADALPLDERAVSALVQLAHFIAGRDH
ncbi:polyprenyl synthetase family protein [Acidiferrimicrobium sp. IK]|uniref:polyprenyl synthetase family protein n=1 Tax=Acidiferrimicrobium sp. IK TaxID=2871700 RepID=UPI0021CB9483|nr:polyprenyl synthetase family protein [Acidiferrimicrobium sp. IK]MCU4185349.1 polyprenyl synthetase family protein [Acidiferrimicrobium sp. IK]